MSAVPTVVRLAAGTLACSCVALKKVVARGLPFQFTTDVGLKPLPSTVRVKPGLSAKAHDGLRLVMMALGLRKMLPAPAAYSVLGACGLTLLPTATKPPV